MLTAGTATGTTGRHGGAGTLWVGNFEVEAAWGRGEAQLPALGGVDDMVLVHRMSELALWLAGPGDAVVVATPPDEGLLQHVSTVMGARPTVVPVHPTAEDPAVTAAARRAWDAGELVVPPGIGRLRTHGTSAEEEDLARALGLELDGPDAQTCRQVNSKVYSRRLAEEAGLTQPAGGWSSDLDGLERLVETASRLLEDGPVVVKEAFGVSGKGLIVVRTQQRLERVARALRSAARAQGGRAAFCVEQWVDKQTDLNYQFTLDDAGAVSFDVVKEAVTDRGVHQGHVYPPGVPGVDAELEEIAGVLGGRLAADGFRGVVGVDALTTTDGTLHPVIEINARLNMSTYQEGLRHRLQAPHLFAWQQPCTAGPVRFETIAATLEEEGLLADGERDSGVVVMAHTTARGAGGRPGRLFLLAHAPHRERLDDIVLRARRRLETVLTGRTA